MAKITDKDKVELEKLIEALRADNDELVDEIASGLLIDNKGGCNYTNINALETTIACRVFALEKDSFGWLIGGIKYNNKTYSYG